MNLNKENFELFLFTTNPSLAQDCLAAGVNGIIIDWENKEKDSRQNGYPTQINFDTTEDLIQMRKATDKKIICRINKFNPAYSLPEIEDAIRYGADEIFLPMLEVAEDAEQVLEIVKGRCKVAILIETDNAVKNAEDFAKLPLSRVYIGLNDLHISRKSSNIFEPLVNDTVKHIRTVFKNTPVGVGGITHPDEGHPVPCNMLIQQYINLKMDFSFLRRSFLKDLNKYEIKTCIQDIRNNLQLASNTFDKSTDFMNKELKKYFI